MAHELVRRYEKSLAIVRQTQQMNCIGFAPDSETSLYLYARFRQIHSGDVHGPPPDIVRVVDRQKYEAWASIKGINSYVAMYEYLQALHNYSKTLDLSNVNHESQQIGADLIDISTLTPEIHAFIRTITACNDEPCPRSEEPQEEALPQLSPASIPITDSLDQSDREIYEQIAAIHQSQRHQYVAVGSIGEGIANLDSPEKPSLVSEVELSEGAQYNTDDTHKYPQTPDRHDAHGQQSVDPAIPLVNSTTKFDELAHHQGTEHIDATATAQPTPATQLPAASMPTPQREGTASVGAVSPIRIRSRSTRKSYLRTPTPASYSDSTQPTPHAAGGQPVADRLQQQHPGGPSAQASQIQSIYQQLVFQAEDNEDYTLYLILKLMNARENKVELCLHELQRQYTLLSHQQSKLASTIEDSSQHAVKTESVTSGAPHDGLAPLEKPKETEEPDTSILGERVTTLEAYVDNIVNTIHTINVDIMTGTDPTNLLYSKDQPQSTQAQPSGEQPRWLSFIKLSSIRFARTVLRFMKFFVYFLLCRRLLRAIRSTRAYHYYAHTTIKHWQHLAGKWFYPV